MLCYWLGRKINTVPWTEYSLYTSVAETQRQPVRLSRPLGPCYYADEQLFSEEVMCLGRR